MENNKERNVQRYNRMGMHPITFDSAVGRWIAAQDHYQLAPEAALANFGLLLRMGRN